MNTSFFCSFQYCIFLLQWNLYISKGQGTGKMCSCPFPLWIYYYWGKENRSGHSDDYVILRFHCSTIKCIGSNYFWLVKGPFKCVNCKFPYPFKYFNIRSPYTLYTQCLKKVPLSFGGEGAPYGLSQGVDPRAQFPSWANLKTKICKIIASVTPLMLLVSHTDTLCPCLP